jgi:hypothetical protein
MLTTNLSENVHQTSNDEAVSVIHAPESFASWVSEILMIGRVSRLTHDIGRSGISARGVE